MKKLCIFTLVFFVMAAVSFAVIDTCTIAWTNEIGGFGSNPSMGAYNWATDHFLYCDYGSDLVRIGNGTDGSLLGSLSTTGYTPGASLDFFCVCTTTDGVIYAGSEIVGDRGQIDLVRWANEAANPTQQALSPLAPVTLVQFPRDIDAVGTGVDTVIGLTGSNDYNVHFFETTDGTTFVMTDFTPEAPTTADAQIKQGVALAPAMDKVFGTKADGGGQVVRYDKVGGSWVVSSLFTPPNSYTAPPTGLGAASWIGYMPQHRNVIVVGYTDAANDYLSILHADTGGLLFQTQIGHNVATYGYGKVELDEEAGVGYLVGRSATANTEIVGKITFEPYVAPVAADSTWGLYE